LTWFATDTGLYRFDGKSFAVWNAEKGLPGDRVLWLQSDGDDMLWLGFSTGVAEVRRSHLLDTESASSHKLQCDFYDSGDGFFANPVRRSQSAAGMDRDGKLWFATSVGIAVLDSRHIEKNSLPPPVVIERVLVDNRDAPVGSPIRFPPLTKNLQIDYNGLSLVVPRKVQFRYELEGYDKDWQDAGIRRQAFYTNLQPGAYRFHVIAANNDDVWNETGASLDFVVLPAFHQTALFKILCVAAATMIAFGFYRLRMQQMQTALKTRFKDRLAERTRLAQDLHDELLQSAMGVSLQIELTDALIEEPHAAKPHLERALILSRMLMQKGREVLRDLREKERGAEDITRILSNALEEGQQHDGPASRLTVEGQTRIVNPLVADEFVQIGCQAIANAFQHAAARKIVVYLRYKPAELFLEVEDDGRGIDPGIAEAGKPGHYGLIGMRERAQRIGATLTIASGIGEGTKVNLTVPGKHAYREGEKT
jgi:signal transduction histidine kinase